MGKRKSKEKKGKKKMKKITSIVLSLMLIAVAITGCGSKSTNNIEQSSSITQSETAKQRMTESESTSPTSMDTFNDVSIKIGSLKGPTSMGLVKLMDEAQKGEAACDYSFTMVTAADELSGMITSGDVDIAMIPANLASVLYNKTNGAISVIGINTLGVLYFVSGNDSIESISDLKGKTIYLTGKGTTPEYTLNYLLKANGLSEEDVNLEFKSEATEVAALLTEQPDAIGLLPQPFVTVACTQNENLKVVMDLTEEWNNVQENNGSKLITGVTVVRNDFLTDNEAAVKRFLEEYKASTEYVNANVEEAATLVANAGIIEKAPIAAKAIPNCNITYIDGEEMKEALSGYLQVLYQQNPQSVGGELPSSDFYYIP